MTETMELKPDDGQIVIVAGGIAQYRDGVFYTGMEEPMYQRPIEWSVTWWEPLRYQPSAPADEKAAFEKWAADQWQNSNPPDNAWLGWKARAELYAPAEVVEKMAEALRYIIDLQGEINPSNYGHDDVCKLNRSFVESWTIANDAMTAYEASLQPTEKG